MKWVRWIVALLPAAVGTIFAVIAYTERMGNPVLYMRIDRGSFLLLIGLLLSGSAAAYLLYTSRMEKKHQQALQQVHDEAFNERQRFMQRLDHEIKNPVMSIMSNLTNLLRISSEPVQQDMLATVQGQAHRLRQLTGEMRKLAELDRLPLDLELVDVAGLLEQSVALAEERPEAKERRLILTLPQPWPWAAPAILGDRELLLVAVSNILDNALKFTKPKDTVEVRVTDDDGIVSIEIADTGPGIPEDEIPHIGKELFRSREVFGTPGTGMGMAMVQTIARRHGGTVTVRSRVDQGTVVILRLPTAEPA
jgi:two-component system OmpR family sensor kinase